MTVVDKTWIFYQLIFRSVEIRVVSFSIYKIVSGGPSDSQNKDSSVVKKSNFLPPSVFSRNMLVADRMANIFEVTDATSICVVLLVFRLIGNLFVNIESDD